MAFFKKYSLKVSILSFFIVACLLFYLKFYHKNMSLFILCFFFLAIGVTCYPPDLNNKLKIKLMRFFR